MIQIKTRSGRRIQGKGEDNVEASSIVTIEAAVVVSAHRGVKTMNALCDIKTSEDVKTLVDAFYAKVNRDELLAPVFNEVANVDWPAHFPTMYRFWDSMLLGAASYQGMPFPKHAVLPIEQEHFERWLALFVETVNENFAGPKSEEAKGRAVCIADMFARRMGILTDAAALARLHFSGV